MKAPLIALALMLGLASCRFQEEGLIKAVLNCRNMEKAGEMSGAVKAECDEARARLIRIQAHQ